MGHDNQVVRELPVELRERSNGSTPLKPQAYESLQVLDDWWTIYGQIYRDDPSDAAALDFREMLKDFPADILKDACLQAQRQTGRIAVERGEREFRPTPGMISAIAENLLAKRPNGNRPKYLDEPKMSQAEREAAVAETPAELRAKLTGKVNGSQSHDARCLCPACRARRELES